MMKTLLLLLLVFLSACNKPSETTYQGYIEGEWLYLSAPQGGYLETLNIARGDHPAKGSKAFTLSGEQSLQQKSSHTAALEAQLHAAESTYKYTSAQLKRQEELAKQNFASASRTDELISTQMQAWAQVKV